ncbi:hypothetical protein JHD50_03360 [Sulfurimonas sp. MAG313]|nr:hypothetical protein [Sulfurimonas sp. MAG313]MDF1880351.1 hypothetical protein [Sulfurimonas sp. MAG313]
MPYLFGIALLILLFIVLHFFTEISLKQKLGTVSVLAALVLGAYLFNLNSKNRRLHLEDVLLKFTHGNTILCNDLEVNNSYYSYSSGTQTFIGLKETKSFGRLISLDTCQ